MSTYIAKMYTKPRCPHCGGAITGHSRPGDCVDCGVHTPIIHVIRLVPEFRIRGAQSIHSALGILAVWCRATGGHVTCRDVTSESGTLQNRFNGKLFTFVVSKVFTPCYDHRRF